MFRRLAPATNNLDQISRVEAILRARFDVDDTEIVLVSEDPGIKPGFPPFETNILFWKNETRYRLKVFSKVSDVSERDVPVRWLLPSLEDTGEGDCC
ncbi:MAG: hypothetical protein CMM52_06650 [Rhodospirillaceae bacterium]|nr:hypothetical protein [Rhodospirillaceae bacterium]|tara:strand:+ start:9324 stop:9614 length:291 start_codon:yes stop_codon:yes gene_type:complete